MPLFFQCSTSVSVEKLPKIDGGTSHRHITTLRAICTFFSLFFERTRCKYGNCKVSRSKLGFVLHRYRIGMGEKTAADRTGSARRERDIPVYVPTRGEEPAIIERAKIKGLPIKRKWSKRAAPLYADRFVVILYLRLSIVLYQTVAESADRFKRAAILYICGINAKLSFTYSGQKGALKVLAQEISLCCP